MCWDTKSFLLGLNLISFAKTAKNHKQFNNEVSFVQIIEIRAFSFEMLFLDHIF